MLPEIRPRTQIISYEIASSQPNNSADVFPEPSSPHILSISSCSQEAAYEGQTVFIDGVKVPHGYGEMHYPDGTVYTGNFERGKRHGQGKIIYGPKDLSEAVKFHGPFEPAKENPYVGEAGGYYMLDKGISVRSWIPYNPNPFNRCNGLYDKQPITFEGTWSEDAYTNGTGIYQSYSYTGDWFYFWPSGSGTMTYTNRSTRTGEFQCFSSTNIELRDPEGKLLFKGDFATDPFCTRIGTKYREDGVTPESTGKYLGNNLVEGTIYHSTDLRFNTVYDRDTSICTVNFSNGWQWIGLSKDGKPERNPEAFKQTDSQSYDFVIPTSLIPKSDGYTFYLGDLDSEGLPHGTGTCFDQRTEELYIGGFVSGKRHGAGTVENLDGTRYQDEWLDGQPAV